MRMISTGLALILLVAGNLSAVFSEAMVKAISDDSSIFQFILFRQITAVVMLLPWCIQSSTKSLQVGIRWHLIRGHVWLVGMFFTVIALTSLPLATASAIFYTAPLLMLLFSSLLLRETISRHSILSVIVGFVGVLVVIRPTELSWAAISALIVALYLAINNMLIQKLPKEQSVIQMLFMTNLVGIPVALIATVWEGARLQVDLIGVAAASTAFILVYAAFGLLAYRAVESHKIATAEYSGLVSAIIVGIFMFNEIPDVPTIIGSVLIILPLFFLANINKKSHVA
ncbi:DMT family transporter [Vibrio aquimaris]|uniref:EamA-like transporter family protein n=1 Tax=Vibrio aquimaris TaxID=2587862 RepID=A0A5P9CP35_9VIBR|nr:DMT family transporter [Vibrio aquimaris]QFT28005.1 EamA-like transporter family protein [Vibrio aquimaris]